MLTTYLDWLESKMSRRAATFVWGCSLSWPLFTIPQLWLLPWPLALVAGLIPAAALGLTLTVLNWNT